MSIKRVWLLRHGETDWNAQERFQGHLDIPLNDRGRQQARDLIPLLKNHGIDAFLSSDLSRAVETAQIIAGDLGVTVAQDPRLREANLGKAQGLTRAEIEAQFGQATARRWRSSRVSDADISYPGGETGTQVLQRVTEALTSFLNETPYSHVAVATHGGVIRRFMASLKPDGSRPIPIPNTVVYEIEYFKNSFKLPQKSKG